jgi:hypothetical protein
VYDRVALKENSKAEQGAEPDAGELSALSCIGSGAG